VSALPNGPLGLAATESDSAPLTRINSNNAAIVITALPSILSGRLDCGFIGLAIDSPDPELEAFTVAEDHLVAAIPATHALAKKSTVQLADLKCEAIYLTAQANAPMFNPWLVELCRKSGFEPRIVRETDRASTILNYIAAGFGVSIFPSRISSLATPGVRFLPLKGKLPKYQYKFAWLRRNPNRALLEFAQLLRGRR